LPGYCSNPFGRNNLIIKNKRTTEARDIYKQLEMYAMSVDSIYNSAMVTDADGYITYFNKTYGFF